jgi:hypothetical protein
MLAPAHLAKGVVMATRDGWSPLQETLPTPAELREKLRQAMREVDLLKRLLRVSERAAQFRRVDQEKEVGNKEQKRAGPLAESRHPYNQSV